MLTLRTFPSIAENLSEWLLRYSSAIQATFKNYKVAPTLQMPVSTETNMLGVQQPLNLLSFGGETPLFSSRSEIGSYKNNPRRWV